MCSPRPAAGARPLAETEAARRSQTPQTDTQTARAAGLPGGGGRQAGVLGYKGTRSPLAPHIPAAERRRKPTQAWFPQDQSAPDARQKPRWKGSAGRERAPQCAGHLRPGDPALPARLQAWGGSLSPRDRSPDLSYAPATPAPLNLQKRKKTAPDKLQVDKNQTCWAGRSVRTDVG